jgi:hypothetical protein
MSELNLSQDLIKDVQAVFMANDADAEDSVTFAQYLAAITGYIVADIAAPEDKLRDLLSQLNDFSMHVFDEEVKKSAAPTAPGQDAFGIWRPKSQ